VTARPKRKDRPVVRMTFEMEKREGSMPSALRVCSPADEFHAMDLEGGRPPPGSLGDRTISECGGLMKAKSAGLRGVPMSLQLCDPRLRE